MSHFTVLVVTDTNNEDALKKALQPFHEYECTGTKDEFVVFVDCHDEIVKDWAESTETYWEKDGNFLTRYAPEFYRDFTSEEVEKHGPLKFMGSGCGGGASWDSRDWGDGQGYRPKIKMADEEILDMGYTSAVKLLSDGHEYANMYEYAIEYHGYDELQNGRIGRMTNPNAEWDWWQVGGRWSGKLLTLSGDKVDKGYMRDMDFNLNRTAGEQSAAVDWDNMNEVIAGRKLIPYKDVLAKHNDDHTPAREEYWNQPVLTDLKNSGKGNPFTEWPQYFTDRNDFIKRGGENAIATFAFLGSDGKWQQRGDMGWFGMVSDENDEWGEGFSSLLRTVKPDQYIWVVDCHI